eukprot:TRINITY_DN701_c0_g1_i2.p1 TRINITY_DN701_c0_g1~~TRINITY_DN701_c0_g1_i2.p1  ORF type:complete len:489 (-),score=160.99 TRINITY_DN701_c0_g1_i2:47-1513(-)
MTSKNVIQVFVDLIGLEHIDSSILAPHLGNLQVIVEWLDVLIDDRHIGSVEDLGNSEIFLLFIEAVVSKSLSSAYRHPENLFQQYFNAELAIKLCMEEGISTTGISSQDIISRNLPELVLICVRAANWTSHKKKSRRKSLFGTGKGKARTQDGLEIIDMTLDNGVVEYLRQLSSHSTVQNTGAPPTRGTPPPPPTRGTPPPPPTRGTPPPPTRGTPPPPPTRGTPPVPPPTIGTPPNTGAPVPPTRGTPPVPPPSRGTPPVPPPTTGTPPTRGTPVPPPTIGTPPVTPTRGTPVPPPTIGTPPVTPTRGTPVPPPARGTPPGPPPTIGTPPNTGAPVPPTRGTPPVPPPSRGTPPVPPPTTGTPPTRGTPVPPPARETPPGPPSRRTSVPAPPSRRTSVPAPVVTTKKRDPASELEPELKMDDLDGNLDSINLDSLSSLLGDLEDLSMNFNEEEEDEVDTFFADMRSQIGKGLDDLRVEDVDLDTLIF